LTGERLQGQLGRVGIGLYGGNPFANRENPTKAVASLQGRVLQLREVQQGDSVGYGATLVVEARTTVAVVALGYADGVPRRLSNRGQMAVNGQRCRILGRVSMDMVMVDATAVGRVVVGDWVECFGSVISVDEVAAWADTIAYEVLTGVGPRVARVYVPTQSPLTRD
jgi:alanine racemase